MVAGTAAHLKPRPPTRGYVELHAHSDHSLLDGVPSPEALVARAAELGMDALALTDHDALYGAVRFALAAQEAGVKPILGAEMTLEGAGSSGPAGPAHLTLLVETPAGYANLCRLITLARRGQEKGVARLSKQDLVTHAGGLIALSGCRRGEIPRMLSAGQFERALEAARGYARVFGPDRFFVELQRHYRRGDKRLLAGLAVLASRAGLDVVATGNSHYLHPPQREVHDVLTCIRCRTTLEDAGGGSYGPTPSTTCALRGRWRRCLPTFPSRWRTACASPSAARRPPTICPPALKRCPATRFPGAAPPTSTCGSCASRRCAAATRAIHPAICSTGSWR